jgi:la-related protein 1
MTVSIVFCHISLDGGVLISFRFPGSKKPSNRLPRSHDESTESAPPSVADATAWPTPQIALGEEKRKAQEKNEKTDRNERSPSIRGKEKWTPVPYVPTAVFNTPLPSARRGGRPSRGGRDNGRGGAHGSHNASGADNKSVSGQNQASSKQAALSERGRVETNLARTNSLPAQGRRPTSVDVNVQSEPRRPSQGLDRSRGESRTKASEDVHSTTNGTQTNASDATAKAQREGRSGKAQEFIPANRGVDNGAKMGTLPAEGQGNNRFTPSHERRFEGIPRSGEFPRDSNGFVPKERDHRDFNRDKGEFQRDREQQRERGESRPERGRGGYRGRGGHSYGNGQQNQHFSNSQISQHPFIPAKSFGVNDRQRPQQQQQQQQQQQGFQNGTQSHNSGHRLSLRSPSLPNSAGLYGAYPLPEINTMYAGYQPMHTGPMTAVPYQPYMEPFSLIGMIQMQL